MEAFNTDRLKIAIVHDWLPLIGGAERVLEEILKIYPHADVFTLFNFLSDEQLKSLGVKNIQTSYLNKLWGVKKYYRQLLPFCPLAIEDFNLFEYDLVISSSHAVAKGVVTGAHQTHVSYVHSPARYAWDLLHPYLIQSGLNKGPKGMLAKFLLSNFRIWDYRTANGVDHFIANSAFIKKRIWKVYRREAEVIYPAVNVDAFTFCKDKKEYYITASRMVPYKRMDMIVEAFTRLPEKNLVVIGDGPEMEKIKNIANGHANINLMGYQETPVLKTMMGEAKAFVFAAEEDFGIIPVEAQACGTPVIAYAAGGALETVVGFEENAAQATGVFFKEQTVESLMHAVKKFDSVCESIKPENCRANAEKFAASVFRKKFSDAIQKALKNR